MKKDASCSMKKRTMIDIANSGTGHGKLTTKHVILCVTGKSLRRVVERDTVVLCCMGDRQVESTQEGVGVGEKIKVTGREIG